MNYKERLFIPIFLILFGVSKACGQTELLVDFSKCDNLIKSKGFRFSIFTQSDTLSIFNLAEKEDFKKKTVSIPSSNHEILGMFEYSLDLIEWMKIEYPITLEKDLKRIEIALNFAKNNNNVEFLQDFTIDKYWNMAKFVLEYLSQAVWTPSYFQNTSLP